MKVKILVDNPRLNEIAGVFALLIGLGLLLSLVSYSPGDPSTNVASAVPQADNWVGLPGAFFADVVLQSLGLAGFVVPVWLGVSGWKRIRHAAPELLWRRPAGALLLTLVLCTVLEMAGQIPEALLPDRWESTVRAGGAAGGVLADAARSVFNVGGTVLLLAACTATSLYLLTSGTIQSLLDRLRKAEGAGQSDGSEPPEHEQGNGIPVVPEVAETAAVAAQPTEETLAGAQPAEDPEAEPETGIAPPIVPYEEPGPDLTIGEALDNAAREEEIRKRMRDHRPRYKLPEPALLNPPMESKPYDEAQLQETAKQIVEKFEEFGVRGSVNQINPGPVVTTFEFKPDRGMKYSRIVNLSEDLCLALECESILVERLPGKPTIGIEVPNRSREVITLREVIDSPAFRQSQSMLTFALGKDINGKLHCTDLAGMPHLLVAGQTGSGKSVMVNCVIMSILLRATPEDVRLILVDPKTVELGLYGEVPHLLTPVITDMKEAANALKNATLEMERRLQLLAQHGVRNISQFNERVARSNPEADTGGANEDGSDEEPIEKLPFIVVIVDELADLMMLAGRQVEESIQRLAQMARAVGIHLILATQRPSVDVITGLIKANIPARMSFLLATRVDSRTILDSMGAESLLGKGDMLFLPPGTARRRRLHGPLVSEDEIAAVVSHWKEQAIPEFQNEFLQSPEGEQEDANGAGESFDDPMYRDAVQLVLEMGKASTSTLQRRLRIGYGRSARMLDAMESEGIIGPPDGSRPREVLRRPEWLDQASSPDPA